MPRSRATLAKRNRIDWLAEQVNGNDRPRGLCDERRHMVHIDIERLRIDVGEDRLAPSRVTALAVAKNVKLGKITSSPLLMSKAISASSKRVAARGAADGMFGLAVAGHLLFKLRHIRAEHKGAALPDAFQRGQNLRR